VTSVRVRAPLPLRPRAPVLVKLIAPVPDDASVPPVWATVNSRSVLPPSPSGAAHPDSYYFGARNRVWLARRHLPLPLGFLYVIAFALRTVPRLKSWRSVQESARGYRDGLRGQGGRRRPLKASTLLRMVRAGRPPIM
jgi:hypothetical protein